MRARHDIEEKLCIIYHNMEKKVSFADTMCVCGVLC
jgi:hypothetical protein